jgi:ribosomal protein L24
MSTDIVVKSDYSESSRKRRRPKMKKAAKKVKTEPHIRKGTGVLVIPGSSNSTATSVNQTPQEVGVIVVSSINIRQQRIEILNNWNKYTPKQIVEISRTYYTADDKMRKNRKDTTTHSEEQGRDEKDHQVHSNSVHDAFSVAR